MIFIKNNNKTSFTKGHSDNSDQLQYLIRKNNIEMEVQQVLPQQECFLSCMNNGIIFSIDNFDTCI